jgi:pimeloyl-ACP methyl ester carboxylesterase
MSKIMSEDFLEKKYLDSNAGGQICYFLGPKFANRPTLVFLHGLAANHTTWNNTISALSQLGINCLSIDQRGHGYSDKSKKRSLYKISVFTQDLKEILTKENLSKIILAGYSYGGLIALNYAIKYPNDIHSLILVSANHVNPFRYKFFSFITWPSYFILSLAAWLLLWQKRKNYYYFNQDKDIGYWRSTLRGFLTMPLSINFWMLSEVANIDFSQNISKIVCPTLLVRSQDDAFVSLKETEDMAQKIKSAKIKTIEEPTHFLASRHQQKTIEATIEFLKERQIL